MAAGNRAAQGPTFADEMLLADELRERPRAHACRQRLRTGRGHEERLGPGSWGSAGGHGPMVRRGTMAPAGSGRELELDDPQEVDDDEEHKHHDDEPAVDDGDSSDVALDVRCIPAPPGPPGGSIPSSAT